MKLATLLLTGFVLALFATPSSAQIPYSEQQPTLVYYDIGLNSAFGKIRDFATSPLFYSGQMQGANIDRIKVDHTREVSFGIRTLAGSSMTAEVDGDVVGRIASFTAFHFFYSRLYQIRRLSNSRWNTKAGGTADINANIRVNPGFQNNAVGFEGIFTVSASGKVTVDISRTEQKEGSILGIGYSLAPRVRTLSYKLNLGVFNNNYRNGYIYTNHSPIFNDGQVGYDYKINLFSGFRIGTTIKYTLYNRKNSNAFVIGVEWNGYKTGADYEKLEASALMVSASLLFNSR